MPKGPSGEKRPADMVGAAIKVARISTGEEVEGAPPTASAAAQLGNLGGASEEPDSGTTIRDCYEGDG